MRFAGYSILLHVLLAAAIIAGASTGVERAAPGIVRVLLLAEEGPALGGDVPDGAVASKQAREKESRPAKAPPKPKAAAARKARLVAEAAPSATPPASPATGWASSVTEDAAPLRVARRPAGGDEAKRGGAERDRRIGIIQDQIRRALHYPRAARRRGLEGTVHVRFGIRRDGRVDGLAVRRSSGHRLLDRASMKTIERAQPFPFVDGALEVPVVFQLTGAR